LCEFVRVRLHAGHFRFRSTINPLGCAAEIRTGDPFTAAGRRSKHTHLRHTPVRHTYRQGVCGIGLLKFGSVLL
jgi:hypothetical protein